MDTENFKTGINVFTGIDDNSLLSLGAKAGFNCCFSEHTKAANSTKFADFARLAEKSGLILENAHSTIPGCREIWKEGAAGDKYIDTLLININNCHANNVPVLVVHAEIDEKAQNDTALGISRLKRVVDYAKAKDIKIAFENINSAELLFEVTEHFMDCGFCYDSGHEACYSNGLRYLPRLGDRLLCTHLHDNNNIDDMHLIPFDGDNNFDLTCKELKACGYKGSITLELAYGAYYKSVTPEEFILNAHTAALRIAELIK